MSQSKIRFSLTSSQPQYAEARQKSIAAKQYNDYWSELMVKEFHENSGQSIVLDVMCGSGELARILRPKVGVLYSTDISPGILSYANPAVSRDHIICSDAHLIPFPDAAFDAVFIRTGLHHTPNTYSAIVDEVYRVLRPGGVFILSEPIDDNPIVHLVRSTLHVISPIYEPGERGFLIADLYETLSAAGFSEITDKRFGYLGYTLIGNVDVFPLFKNLKNEFIINTLIKLDRISETIPVWSSLALCTIMRAKKV
jgi:ubiquinone/menaquinone biosynthesis C-methylase UbiE